jgi:hypothetical protein
MISDESKMTQRLQAESDGVIMILECTRRTASDFKKLFEKTNMLELTFIMSDRRLADIQLETISIVVPGCASSDVRKLS